MTPAASLPQLIDHRADALSALCVRYHPYETEMAPDRTLSRLFADPPRLQYGYESLATPDAPGDGLIRRYYPTVRCGERWLPEPVDYLRQQGQFLKVDELFEEDDSQQYVRQLCRRRGASTQWIEDNLEDVLATTVVDLNTSHLLPTNDRRPTNDYERFLHEWKDSYSLTAFEAPLARRRLVEKAADNPLRRMFKPNRTPVSVGGDHELDLLAAIGDRVYARPDGNLDEWLDGNTSLSEDEARVLRLRLVGGLTFQEIGELMGNSTTSGHRLFVEARRKLAEWVRNPGGDNL